MDATGFALRSHSKNKNHNQKRKRVNLNLLLFGLFCIVAPSVPRFSMCAVLAAFASHWAFDPQLTAFGYYGYGVLSNVTVVLAIKNMAQTDRIDILIQRCCLAFALVNALGYLIWHIYWPKEIYNALCSVLYLTLIFITFRGGSDGCSVVEGFTRRAERFFNLVTSGRSCSQVGNSNGNKT